MYISSFYFILLEMTILPLVEYKAIELGKERKENRGIQELEKRWGRGATAHGDPNTSCTQDVPIKKHSAP